MAVPYEIPRPALEEDARAEGVVAEFARLDRATYRAIAQTPTPTLDTALRRLSQAADHSKLWIGTAAVLAVVGGARGRRAAITGMVSVGVTSAVVNQGFKRVARRTRPDRTSAPHTGRHVHMPTSTSFPSGHSASAFAFAEAVSRSMPLLGVPLRLSAAVVAYSRVHTGVHYPGDVIVGSLIGTTVGELTGALSSRVATGAGAAPQVAAAPS